MGVFVGFWAVLIQASFAYQGAGEAVDPSRTVPRAICTTFWGVMFLFVAAILLLGMLIPHTDPRLLTESSACSPP